MPDWYYPLGYALTISVGLFLLVAFLIVLYRFSGVPLNETRIAQCPDGIADRDDITPKDFGLHYKPVEVMGELGKLPGWFVAADLHQIPTKMAILVHGRGGSLASCIEVLHAFKDAGWSTLTSSWRGDEFTDESPDGLDHLGDHEWRDLQSFVELAYQAGAEEVVLYGRSAGGQIVGQFLKQGDEKLVGMVSHVVLDDPVLDWRAVFLNNRPGWLPAWVGRFILWTAGLRIRRSMKHFDLAKNPPVARPRLLIIHGEQDEVVPFASSQRFYDALQNEWPMVLVKTNGNHGLSRVEDPSWYDLLIRTWIGGPPVGNELRDRVMQAKRESA